MENNSNMPQRRQKRKIWPFFTVLFFIIAAVAGAMFASSSLFDDPPKNQGERQNKEEGLIKARDKATVLIMGVDVRKDDVGRSDTLMIATIDPQLDRAALLSVPRDTRVRISGHGFDKINAAFAYGGEPLTEKTVENFLGVDIDHYVIINTKSFVKIIDAIGGVDIDVEKRMYYEDPWDDDGGLYIDLYPGMQHMDGKTAVTYVRYRDSEGDIGRIRRQQKFMEACMDKVTSPDIITKIPSVIREVIDAVETDMTFRQLLELAGALKSARDNGLTTEMVPGRPMYIDGISYWIPDVEEIRYAVAKGLGVSVDPTLKQRTEKVANEYNDSIPSTAADIPEGEENIGRPVRRTRDYSNDSNRRNYTRQTENNSETTERRNEPTENTPAETTTTERNYSTRRETSDRQTSERTDTNSRRYDSEDTTTRIERREIPETYNEPFEDVPSRSENSTR